jgi:hypothetical protein
MEYRYTNAIERITPSSQLFSTALRVQEGELAGSEYEHPKDGNIA